MSASYAEFSDLRRRLGELARTEDGCKPLAYGLGSCSTYISRSLKTLGKKVASKLKGK
jgi:hypothetical protein